MAAKGTVLSKAQVVRMMQSAKRTSTEMREAQLEGYRQRQSDPLERAKLALQRAGRVVFSHSLHVPGSTLLVVGRQTMTPAEMVEYAERFGRW